MRLSYFKDLCKSSMQVFIKSASSILVLLLTFFGYGMGFIEGYDRVKVPVIIQEFEAFCGFPYGLIKENSAIDVDNVSHNKDSNQEKGVVVASKTGTRYYFPWCSGRNRIKPENEIWFSSIEDAEKRGLKPAANCLGL